MDGAWIYPDGSYYFTSNAESHYKIISELNLENNLLQQDSEIDICTLALKNGFIRIIAFNDELSIDSGKFPIDISQYESIIRISNHFLVKKWILFDVISFQSAKANSLQELSYVCLSQSSKWSNL